MTIRQVKKTEKLKSRLREDLKGLSEIGYKRIPNGVKEGDRADVIDLDGNQHVCKLEGTGPYAHWVKLTDGYIVEPMCIKVHV